MRFHIVGMGSTPEIDLSLLGVSASSVDGSSVRAPG